MENDSFQCCQIGRVAKLSKNELFLTVDIENDACVPPGGYQLIS